MEGMQRLCHLLLMITLSAGCHRHECYRADDDGLVPVTISFGTAGQVSKARLPDEDMVSGICLSVFDEDGELEEYETDVSGDISLSLYKGRSYSLFAWANTGENVRIGNMNDVLGLKHRLRHPYDYGSGLPMTAHLMRFVPGRDTSITMELERMMSKISIRMDRSALGEDTEIMVDAIRIGNCPVEAYMFRQSRITDLEQRFDAGFERTDTDILNESDSHGISGAISLYMLENMQGRVSDERPGLGNGTIPDSDDPRKDLSSFVEIEMRYKSDSLYCSGEPLIYRFYIGDGLNSLDVERNCHYHIVIRPEDDGLPEDGWRVDKTGLRAYVQEINLSAADLRLNYRGHALLIEAFVLPLHAYNGELSWESSDEDVAAVDAHGMVTAIGEGSCIVSCSSTDGSGVTAECRVNVEFDPPYFKSFPEEKYIRGDIGDTVRIWCDIFPPYTPFDIGRVYLEADRKDGIYDFIIDEDGHGVTLILKGPGTGLLYMEAGEPVNEAELYLIEVNMPDSDNVQYGIEGSP